MCLTLSNLSLPLPSSSTTSREYCCRNPRLVADEDDFKWGANEEKISLLLKQSHENVTSKNPRRRKLGHSSEMQNDSLMHREGLKG